MPNEKDNLERATTIEQLMLTLPAKRIIAYAKRDKTNKLQVRPDNYKQNIERVLRSPVAMRKIIASKSVTKQRMDSFKKEWNLISPLYPGQTASLRKNHSSGVDLSTGEKSVVFKLKVVTTGETEAEDMQAIEWLKGLSPNKAMKVIRKLYGVARIAAKETPIESE